jgi:hypothetical protein
MNRASGCDGGRAHCSPVISLVSVTLPGKQPFPDGK